MPLYQTYSALNREHNTPLAITNTARSGSISLDDGTVTPCVALILPEQAQLVYTLKEVRELVAALNGFVENVEKSGVMSEKPLDIVKKAREGDNG